MNVYVAAKFQEKIRAKKFMSIVQTMGHHLTHDWTNEDSNSVPPEQRDMYHFVCAMNDLNGALGAEVLVLLGHPDVKGALVEFGIALGRGATILVVDHEKCMNIFFHCDQVKLMTEEKAIEYLRALRRIERKTLESMAGAETDG